MRTERKVGSCVKYGGEKTKIELINPGGLLTLVVGPPTCIWGGYLLWTTRLYVGHGFSLLDLYGPRLSISLPGLTVFSPWCPTFCPDLMSVMANPSLLGIPGHHFLCS